MRRMPTHRDEWLFILIVCAILGVLAQFLPKYTYTDPQKRYPIPKGIPRYSDNPDR